MHERNDATHDLEEQDLLVISGADITLQDVIEVSCCGRKIVLSNAVSFVKSLSDSVDVIQRSLEQNIPIYGVNTNFGGMAETPISLANLSDVQHSLIWGLKCSMGRELPVPCIRAAMLLRCHALSRGASGIRLQLISRFVNFLNSGMTPLLHDIGSLGASGDLIPLSYIAGAITGFHRQFSVRYDGEVMDCLTALGKLNLQPMTLGPKEGLSLVNGTSVSTGLAAISAYESRRLLDLSLGINAIFCSAMAASHQPFDEFVHRMKPHPGQQQVAAKMRSFLIPEAGTHVTEGARDLVQDRYSIRCIPQYFGPLLDGLRGITHSVETEINSTDDNPLVDVEGDRVLQAGNFYGQYVGIGMDQLRQYLALIAKQLDAQISLLVAPEFNRGLPGCLAAGGNEIKFGLKGLQIYLNSILPRLLHLGNPLVAFFPTHAEQFNQNVNSQSFNAAVLALESLSLLKCYMAGALVFAVQSIEMRAFKVLGSYAGCDLLSLRAARLLRAIYSVVGCEAVREGPLVSDRSSIPLDQHLSRLFSDLNSYRSQVFMAIQGTED
jgi:phenylalanine ammonia-lyase